MHSQKDTNCAIKQNVGGNAKMGKCCMPLKLSCYQLKRDYYYCKPYVMTR